MTLINLPKMPKSIKLFHSSSGCRTKPVYKYKYDEKYGCPRRVKVGDMDLDDYIQEGRDSVDFTSLGKILIDTKANIVDHFTSKDGEIVDITGTPRNIHEAANLFNELNDSFNRLPSDLKALFDNDINIFKSSYRNGTLASKINSYYQSLVQPAVEKKEGE